MSREVGGGEWLYAWDKVRLGSTDGLEVERCSSDSSSAK